MAVFGEQLYAGQPGWPHTGWRCPKALGLLHAEVSTVTDSELFVSWQRSASRLWQRYSDTELAVILDLLGDTAEQLRRRTEAIAGSGLGKTTKQERSQHAARRVP